VSALRSASRPAGAVIVKPASGTGPGRPVVGGDQYRVGRGDAPVVQDVPVRLGCGLEHADVVGGVDRLDQVAESGVRQLVKRRFPGLLDTLTRLTTVEAPSTRGRRG